MKKAAAILLAALMLAGLCACGGGQKTDMDLAALAADLLAGGVFSDEMTEPAADIAPRLYGFEVGDVKACILYTSSGSTAEEIFLADAGDHAAAVTDLCRQRAENQKTAFKNYAPEEVAKLDSAVMELVDSYVIFIVAADAGAARAIVDGYIR